MVTISLDLRQRILKAYDRDHVTREQVASRFVVSLGMVKKLLRPATAHRDIAPRHRRLHDGRGRAQREVFHSYVGKILLPTLRTGDIVVMDNLSAHNYRQALGLLNDAGVAVRFLPAYSPDFNPIELMWSKVKPLLRKAEARTNEAPLLLAIGEALSRIPQKDATHWLAHCGYGFI